MGADVPGPLRRYRDAQLLSAVGFGVWWVLLSPAILATIGPKGVGGARIAYNAALFVVSPVAGGAVERGDALRLLTWSSLGRVVVYAAAPLLWAFVRQYDRVDYVFAPSFFALMAADGVFVALVNVASIDCGGTDLIAARLGLGAAVTDELRDQFNALHQLFLASLALLGALGAVMVVSFGVAVALYGVVGAAAPARTPNSDEPPAKGGLLRQMGGALRALPSDASYVASLDGRLLWRVFFLAIDTAVEDAVVAVVLPALANELACHPHGIATTGAAYAEHCDGEWRLRGGAYLSVIVAVGKIGGVLAGVVMHARAAEHQAQGDAHYRKLFKSSLLGGLSFLGVPAVALGAVPGLGRDGTYALICLATFGFFLLMTMPKIGFATLLQHMATASDAPGRVFGFTAAFIMVVDSLVVAGLSLCAPSAAMKLSTFLWIAGGSVAAIGLFEGARAGPGSSWGPRATARGPRSAPTPSAGTRWTRRGR
ncbi:hypothetical protein JL720_7407 [Aureococcus anophagefferens]|nr:hypothetical protein JL720_7407 [Aureococcus anophagefferens]